MPNQLSPHELAIKSQQEKIAKEFKKKRLIIRLRKYFILAIVLIVIIAITLTVTYIMRNNILKKSSVNVQPITDQPPQDFKINVKEVKILPQSNNAYDVLMRLSNNNPNWGVPKLYYKIILKDQSGASASEREGYTFIMPNNTKPVIELGLIASKPVVSASVEVSIKEAQRLKSAPELDFTTENLTYLPQDNKSKVNGTLINQTAYSFSEVIINVLAYDQKNNLIGLNYTTINDFTSNTKRDFSVIWRQKLSDNKPKINIEPQVNPFESSQYLNSYQEGAALQY